MHVKPPKTWGKYTSTVLRSDDAGGTVPLAGATVQIDSWAFSYTLKTARDGTFPAVATKVKIVKGETTIGNFTLKKAP
ncbi:hypothetical protein LRD69_01470 [Streptomyces sp. JH14]|uniref:hypothetical protein n=1 Tax=Streptomyces sp. JH14 TaxID=2793630 RepID=UPI0023F7F3BF|nr:hypothetical protein [Streptomyces sp. JH14]MDF6040858.1 hypothetical protein [Streptomyces sp. JH14]